MIGFDSIEAIIEPILTEKAYTRDDDTLLYIEYVRVIHPSALGMRFEDVMRFRARLKLASFESVARARRKVQERNERCRASKSAEDDRYEKWKETREYALK